MISKLSTKLTLGCYNPTPLKESRPEIHVRKWQIRREDVRQPRILTLSWNYLPQTDLPLDSFLAVAHSAWTIPSRRYLIQVFSLSHCLFDLWPCVDGSYCAANSRSRLLESPPDIRTPDSIFVQFRLLEVLTEFGGSFQVGEWQSRIKWPYSPHLKQGWQLVQRHFFFDFLELRTGERVLALIVGSTSVLLLLVRFFMF